MAIGWGSVGAIATVSSTSGNTAVAYPSGITQGNLICMVLLPKLGPTSQPDLTADGWTSNGFVSHGITSGTSNDTGSMRGMVYTRLATGSETGSYTMVWPVQPNAGQAFMFHLTSGSGFSVAFGSAVRTDTTTSWSVTADSTMGLDANDFLFVASAVPTDLCTASTTGVLTATGLTAGSGTRRVAHNTSSAGTDSAVWGDSFQPTAGTASAAPTYTSTLTGGANLYGVSVFVRVHEDAGGALTDDNTDTAGLADAAASTPGLDRADTLAGTDSAVVAAAPDRSDSTGAQDAAASHVELNRSDTVGLTDVPKVVQSSGDGTDPLGLTDTLQASLVPAYNASDVLGLTDTVQFSLAASRTDGLGLTDRVGFDRDITDGAALTDATTSALGATRSATDALGLTDIHGLDQGRAHADTAALADQRALAVGKEAASSAGLIDSIITTAAGSSTYADRQGLSDEIAVVLSVNRVDGTGLVDVVSWAPAPTAADSVALSDAVDVQLTLATALAADLVGLVDTFEPLLTTYVTPLTTVMSPRLRVEPSVRTVAVQPGTTLTVEVRSRSVSVET